ncbi:uncharacterized protein rab44 isoform X2 [Puntigrus tetrazona]|uniref:uncharacterized protein rab44 isoform X2 n=1 Tax=Puntigrus tetrazona TaxID=1606681 RepID=UPI001C8911AC|nr:uncharacterized protein rab44 isoform X2 [Puntigrus tetrazona]
MSGRKSKKNQRLGSSRRGPKGLNRNIEKDDDDGFQQIAESEDGRDEFHTTSATQFDHLPSSSTEQQPSELEGLPHARGHKDSLTETELPERKRKIGSTRKSTARFKGDKNLDDVRTTEELDEEYKTQPNTLTTEKPDASLTEEEQSSFPSDVSHQTKGSGFGKMSGTTLMFAVPENKEILPHSHELVNDMLIDEAVGPSAHSIAVTVAECDLLQKDSVMFNKPKILSDQEAQIASTSGQKRRMGSTHKPLGGQNSENVGVQEHSRNMTENERKAEVMGEAKLKMSEDMVQTWDDVARDDPSSHTKSALLFSQSLLADGTEVKESHVSTGTETETINQLVTFPLDDSEKPLHEIFSHHGTSLLNEALDFEIGSHTEDLDGLNKVLKEAGSHSSDNSQHVSDTKTDTNPSYDFRDVNTEAKKEVLKQKEDTQLEELSLRDQESSLSQHDIAALDNSYDCSMVQTIVGGCRSFDMPVSNISHTEPTTPNLPHKMKDDVEERQEIHIEIKQENNVCKVTCDTLTDLVSVMEEDKDPHILAMRENENMSDERGSETEYAFEMTDQGDVRDHNVSQIMVDVRGNEKDIETSTETICISHQLDFTTEKGELYRGQEHFSLNISLTHSTTQDNAGKMLENEEVRKGQKETENAAVNDVSSESEEMFSCKDLATDRGSHVHQQLLMQSPDKGYHLHENFKDRGEKKGILFSVESENAAFDRHNVRSEGTDRIKEMDAAPDVEDADLHLEIEAQNKTFDSTNSEADGTERNVSGASVLVRENKVIKNTVESTSHSSDFPDSHMEALKVSENCEKEVSGETNTIHKQSDISIIPEDSQREKTQSKSSPVIQKRKMGSTRRPLRGNAGQRKGHDEKEIFSLEDEPSPEESTYTAVSICDISESQTVTEIHAGSHENTGHAEIIPAEGDTESHSENKMFDSTAVLVTGDDVTAHSHMTTESDFHQTSDANMETLKVSENPEDLSDALRNSQSENQPENKMIEVTSEAEKSEDTTCEANVSVKEDEVIGDADTVKFNITNESNLLQDYTINDTKLEALELSKTTENISAVTDSVLVHDDGTEGSRETDTLPEQSHINIIPDDSHGEEAHSVSSLTVHKRKMGSTRRPLSGNKGQRKETKHHDENETLDSDDMINAEKQTISLENKSSPYESTLQSTKDVTKVEEMEVFEKNDVGPVEESESALLQSSCTLDLVSEESTAISICHITESQTLTDIHVVSQENAGDVERVAAEKDKDLQLEIEAQNKTPDSTTGEAEETQKSIHDATVLVREVEVIGDTDTVESNMTIELDFIQRSPDAHMEALKVSENCEKDVSGETNTIHMQSDISIIPADSHREETHSKSSPPHTQTGPSQNDTGSHLFPEFPESIADFVRDSNSFPDVVMSDALLMKETQIYVSSNDVPPTEVVEMNPVSKMSMQKRKIGSTRKRVKRMVNDKEDEDDKVGASENITNDDEATKSEEKLTPNEAITGSSVHQQLFSSPDDKEGHDIQDILCKSDVQADKYEQNDSNSTTNLKLLIESECSSNVAAEMVSDIPKGEAYLKLKQNVTPKESHREDQPNLNPVVQKRKMGSTRKTLRGHKGQERKTESKNMNENSEGITQEQNTEPHLETSARKTELDEEVEQNFPDDFSHPVASSDIFLEPENFVKEVSQNIHDLSEVNEEKGMNITGNDSNCRSEPINLNEGTQHKFVLTVSHKDNQIVSEAEQTENTHEVIPTQKLKATQDDVVHENNSQKLPATQEKRRKMGSTRRNPRAMQGRNMADNEEILGLAEDDLKEALSIGQAEEVSSVSTTDVQSEMLVGATDLKVENVHSSRPTVPETSENTLLSEIERALNKASQSPLSCDWELIAKEQNPDDLANAPDHNMPENSEIRSLQPVPSAHSEPISPGGRRRKMGSTRKNPRQQLKAEREDEDKEDEEIHENSKENKQEKKDLERVEVSVMHNITENKLNKEYLDVSSAHASSNQLQEGTNPVSQEKTSPSTKRKFGSRRANKGKQGLSRLADSDFDNELEDGDQQPDSFEVKDKLNSADLAACDPCISLQPENQPASEQRNMEAINEEAAPKDTGAGLVSFEQIIKHDSSTKAKQAVHLKNRISDTEVVQFNVVMVGNSCVGKTSFIRRFHEGQFTEDYRSTIGVDTCVQTVALPDKTVKLHIWDTAGQERFHSITTQMFHKADGLLLMYEITCSKSFISVRDWISQARERAPDDVIMMLLGNKNDSVKREVQIQEGADLAREYNIHFMECSAATGANVSESMMGLAEMLVQRKSQKEKHTTLRRDPPQKKSGCC